MVVKKVLFRFDLFFSLRDWQVIQKTRTPQSKLLDVTGSLGSVDAKFTHWHITAGAGFNHEWVLVMSCQCATLSWLSANGNNLIDIEITVASYPQILQYTTVAIILTTSDVPSRICDNLILWVDQDLLASKAIHLLIWRWVERRNWIFFQLSCQSFQRPSHLPLRLHRFKMYYKHCLKIFLSGHLTYLLLD